MNAAVKWGIFFAFKANALLLNKIARIRKVNLVPVAEEFGAFPVGRFSCRAIPLNLQFFIIIAYLMRLLRKQISVNGKAVYSQHY